MRKMILCVFLCLSIALPSQVKPISNSTRKLVSALVALGAGAASGFAAYLIVKDFEDREIGLALRNIRAADGEANVNAIKENYESKKIWIPAVAGVVGALAGGGVTYLALGKYTPEAKVEAVKKSFEVLEGDGYIDEGGRRLEELKSGDRGAQADALDRIILKNTCSADNLEYVECDDALKRRKNFLKALSLKLSKAKKDGGCDSLKKMKREIVKKREIIDTMQNVLYTACADKLKRGRLARSNLSMPRAKLLISKAGLKKAQSEEIWNKLEQSDSGSEDDYEGGED